MSTMVNSTALRLDLLRSRAASIKVGEMSWPCTTLPGGARRKISKVVAPPLAADVGDPEGRAKVQCANERFIDRFECRFHAAKGNAPFFTALRGPIGWFFRLQHDSCNKRKRQEVTKQNLGS